MSMFGFSSAALLHPARQMVQKSEALLVTNASFHFLPASALAEAGPPILGLPFTAQAMAARARNETGDSFDHGVGPSEVLRWYHRIIAIPAGYNRKLCRRSSHPRELSMSWCSSPACMREASKAKSFSTQYPPIPSRLMVAL